MSQYRLRGAEQITDLMEEPSPSRPVEYAVEGELPQGLFAAGLAHLPDNRDWVPGDL